MFFGMNTQHFPTISLDNFEGPLDFLLSLVQNNEIAICDVTLQQITEQYLEKLNSLNSDGLDTGAEFIGATAMLLLWKSKALLPVHHTSSLTEDGEPDPRFKMIQQLIEYCRFKDLAQELLQRESQQAVIYERGVDAIPDAKKPLGLDHLSLQDLAVLFKQVLAKASTQQRLIYDEPWQVSDKILHIRHLLRNHAQILFTELFSPDQCREELIVTFLALLELIKVGDARAVTNKTTHDVIIIPNL